MTDSETPKCPTCKSPDPHLHPMEDVLREKVGICADRFHAPWHGLVPAPEAAPPEVDSRSRLKRIAIMKGEPMPTFAPPAKAEAESVPGWCFDAARQIDNGISIGWMARLIHAAWLASDESKRAERSMLTSMLAAQRESFERTRPLCPDHRDKQRGECMACHVERLERALRIALQGLGCDCEPESKSTLEAWYEVHGVKHDVDCGIVAYDRARALAPDLPPDAEGGNP